MGEYAESPNGLLSPPIDVIAEQSEHSSAAEDQEGEGRQSQSTTSGSSIHTGPTSVSSATSADGTRTVVPGSLAEQLRKQLAAQDGLASGANGVLPPSVCLVRYQQRC